MKFKKLLVGVLSITMVFTLFGCGTTEVQTNGQDQVKSASTGGVNEVDDSQRRVTVKSYEEELARYYTTDITVAKDSAIAGKLEASDVEYEDTAVLQAATEEDRAFITETVPSMGKFMEVAEDIMDTGIQLYSETTNNEMLSYAYFLDGGVQLTYVKQWYATDNLLDFADEVASDIIDYVGLDITGDDLKYVQNMIMEDATGGQYSFVITNEEAMDGFYMSVVGYGTEEASWQIYAQRYILSAGTND